MVGGRAAAGMLEAAAIIMHVGEKRQTSSINGLQGDAAVCPKRRPLTSCLSSEAVSIVRRVLGF